MARIRTIKPEFPQSESMGRVSRDARLTFIMLWTLSDDIGRLRGSSRMLASLLFPYDDDAKDGIEGWLAELDQEGCIRRYTIGTDSYLEICKWQDHQKIDKPSKSKIPPFDESSRILANPREVSSGDQGSRTEGPKEGTKDQGPPSQPSVAQPPIASEIPQQTKPERAKRKGRNFKLPELEMSPEEESAFERVWTAWPKLGWNFATKSASPRRIHRSEAALRFQEIIRYFPYTKGDGGRLTANDLAEASLVFVGQRVKEAQGGPPSIPCIDNFYSSVDGQKNPWKDALQSYFASEVAS